MKKDAIRLTFSHKVTKDELIASLERILKQYGCPNCGLNGWDGIFLQGDPDPFISQIRDELINERINYVINVDHFQAPAAQGFNRAAQFNQG